MLGTAATAFVVWYVTSRHTLQNSRPLGGPEIDISHAPRVQSETTIAIDPSHPHLLLAGSNDELFVTRVYSSRDRGRDWRSLGGPPLANRAQCGDGDPAITISRDGSEYYAFLADLSCTQGNERPHLFVAARSRFGAQWRSYAVAHTGGPHFLWDDKPAIAVDDSSETKYRGRVYLVWSRLVNQDFEVLEISRSDDDGHTWATPIPVGADRFSPQTSSVAVGPGGVVYVAAADPLRGGLWLARSTDGGVHFVGPHRVASTAPLYSTACHASAFPVPAQADRCVNANPIVNVFSRGRHAGEVVLTYETREQNGTQGVYAEAFDDRLRRLFRVRVNPADHKPADQFLPASAIDPITEDLWSCFYDTTGDASRTHAWYTCTVSHDGGRTWLSPVRAADAPSDETHGGYQQYGDYEGVAAFGGVAHPIWTDTRKEPSRAEEVYTTAIRATRLR